MSENPCPLIYVVTVVFNAAGEIQRTIDSVRAQRYENVEHIIIDGGSTDGTVDILRRAGEKLCFWSSEPDSGIYQAMNKGLDRARGELIGTLNAGDSYPPEALSNLLEARRDSPHSDVYHGNVCLVSRRDGYQETLLPELDYRLLAVKMTVNHPGSFIRRSAYLKYGSYSEEYRVAGDYDLFLRFYRKGATFKYIDRTMASMPDGGISDTRAMESAFECHAIRTAHGLPVLRSSAILARDVLLIRLRDLAGSLRLYPVIRLWRRINSHRVKKTNRRIPS